MKTLCSSVLSLTYRPHWRPMVTGASIPSNGNDANYPHSLPPPSPFPPLPFPLHALSFPPFPYLASPPRGFGGEPPVAGDVRGCYPRKKN